MGEGIENFLNEIKSMIETNYKGEERISSQIDALNLYYVTKPTKMTATIYEPSICIIAQGKKEVEFGDELRGYDTQTYLLSSVYMPAHFSVLEASSKRPFLGLTITFSMEQIFDALQDIATQSKIYSSPKRGLYFGTIERRLLEPITRLVRLLEVPEDIDIMTPLIIKEILYMLLRDEGGDFIRQYVMDGSAAQRVVEAIIKIKNSFKEPLNIKELARSVSFSESSLYHNFKKITAVSPLQFQKQLRLHEARQMLITQDIDVSQAAFEVGYESPSQFSREYSRMYGLAPRDDRREHINGNK